MVSTRRQLNTPKKQLQKILYKKVHITINRTTTLITSKNKQIVKGKDVFENVSSNAVINNVNTDIQILK